MSKKIPDPEHVTVADFVSMHNHDNGSSSDALYVYGGCDTRKIAYRLGSATGLSAEISTAIPEQRSGQEKTRNLALSYEGGAIHLCGGYGKDGGKHQLSVRGVAALSPFVIGAYLKKYTNVRSAGRRDTSLTGKQRRQLFDTSTAYLVNRALSVPLARQCLLRLLRGEASDADMAMLLRDMPT